MLLVLVPLVASCDRSAPVLGGAAAESFLHATRLALEVDREERGPLAVDTALAVEVSSRAGPALAVAERLVEIPGLVAVIGHANSPASLATSQIYNRNEVVQIAPTATAPLYSEAGSYSFRMVPPDDRQGGFLARMVADSFPDVRRIAVLYVNDDYGRGLRAEAIEALETDGRHEVVVDLPHTETDVAPLDGEHHLAVLGDAEPDLVLWLGRVPALAQLLPRVRDRLGDVPVVGGDALSRVALFSERGRFWRNVAYVDFVDMEATEELRTFGARYRERFDAEAGGTEALAYDAAGVVLAALREGASTGPEVRDYLRSLGRERPPYPGVTGPVRFDARGNVERSFVLRFLEPTGTPRTAGVSGAGRLR